MENQTKWQMMTPEAVAQKLGTGGNGLSRKAVRQRLKQNGTNTLFDERKKKIEPTLRALLLDPALLILLVVAILSLCFLSFAYAIPSLVLAVFCGWIVSRDLRKIRENSDVADACRMPQIHVIREGKTFTVPARRVVAGDLICLRAGDIVPCDCRLIMSQSLRVYTYLADENGKMTYRELPKNATTVYRDGDETVAPMCENMLYGGSQILFGCGFAIAVETGAGTYLASLPEGTVPAEPTKNADREPLPGAISTFLRLYGFGALILFVPLSLIGVLTAPESFAVQDVFLTAACCLGVMSPALLSALFRFVAARAGHAGTRDPRNRAVQKSGRVTTVLPRVNDLFIVGHGATSDGKFHLHRCAVGSGEIDLSGEAPNPDLGSVCEAYYLYYRARVDSAVGTVETGDDGQTLRDELTDAAAFDTKALELRLERVNLCTDPRDAIQLIEVATHGERYELLFSEDEHLIDHCTLYQNSGRLCAMEQTNRAVLAEFCRAARNESAKPIVVVRKNPDQTMILVAVLAVREQFQSVTRSTAEELMRSGVRVTFFLCGNARDELRYARNFHLPESAVTVFDGTEPTAELLTQKRIFIGYPARKILDLLKETRSQKRRVAVIADRQDELALLYEANLAVSCDGTEYQKPEHRDAVPRYTPDGMTDSERCAQTARRCADLLIPRADRFGGGLVAFANAFSRSRETLLRMRVLFAFLFVSQGTRLLLTLLSFCTGTGIFTGAQMIWSFFAELTAVSLILALPIGKERLSPPARLDTRALLGILSDFSVFLPAACASVIPAVTVIILRAVGVLSPDAVASYLFASLLLIQLFELFRVLRRAGIRCKIRQGSAVCGIILLPVALLSLLTFLLSDRFPVFATVTGLSGFGAVTLIGIALVPILYFATLLILKLIANRKRSA